MEKVQISYLGIRIIAYILFLWILEQYRGFPHSSVVKQYACNAGDLSSIPGLGRSSGQGNGYPFQCSCLENFMDRGAWQAIVHGVA